MKKYKKLSFKILIIIMCAVALLIAGYFVFQRDIFNNQGPERIKITKIKAEYGTSEDIIIEGTAKKDCDIIILWGSKIGTVKANRAGNWSANLGRASEGKYPLEVIAEDSPNSRSITTAKISVVNGSIVSTIEKLSNFLMANISFNQNKNPEKLNMIPKSSPQVLSGEWELIK